MTNVKIVLGILIWGILFWVVGGSWLDDKRQITCNDEVQKDKPDLAVVKKRCIETADYYMEEGYYGSAAWFYLLGGDLEKNLNEVEAKVDDDFYMNIGHTYLLKGEYTKAQKIYENYIWYEDDEYIQSDDSMQEDFKILQRLYPDKKENIAKGIALWNEIYAPIKKILTAYQDYESAEEDGNQSDAIKYLKQTLKYSSNYKDKEVIEYWDRVEMLAQLYQDEDKEKKAIKEYQKLEKHYEKESDKVYEYNELLLLIAKLSRYISEDDQALVYYKKILAYQEKNDEDNASLAITYDMIGNIYSSLNHPNKALEAYRQSIERQQTYLQDVDFDTLDSTLETLETYYASLANQYLSMEQNQTALSIREAYINFLQSNYEGDYQPLANAYHNMARYLSDRNNTLALFYQLMAIYNLQELTEREYEPNTQESAVEALFDLYEELEPYILKSNDYNTTLTYQILVGHMEALRDFQEQTFNKKEVNHLILAKTYNVMYNTYSSVHDGNNTKKYAQKAVLQIQEAIEEEEGEEEYIKENHATLLNQYYYILLNETKMRKEITTIVDEYMKFQMKHYAENFTQLSEGHQNVARFFKSKKEFELATNEYNSSLIFAEKALEEEESYENRELVKQNLYALLSLYGEDYTNYTKAIESIEELSKYAKENYPDEKLWLSSSYDALAEVYTKENNQSVEISKNYKKSINLFKEEILDSNSSSYLYELRESYVRLSSYYAKQKEKERSIATMQALIDFTIAQFPDDKAELAKGYKSFSEIYDLLKEDKNILLYKERAFSTIEMALKKSQNYEEYFYDFENYYDTLQELYKKRQEKYKIIEGIEVLKEMLKKQPEENYQVALLKMISYAYLITKEYKKSLLYITKANKMVDESYTLECRTNLLESYASEYIYLDTDEVKALEKACDRL